MYLFRIEVELNQLQTNNIEEDMKIKALSISVFIALGINAAHTAVSDFMPSAIYKLDQKFSHHVIVVEKSTHSLFLYKNDQGFPELIKKYQIATGKKKGNKLVQGDKKTPEGIYHFQKFHSSANLTDKYGKTGLIYGAGAFTMNYPNEIDARNGKTGGGIWLHSTDDDARVSKGLDSRGCVVAIDSDLKEISQYIDLNNTPVVIVQDLNFLSKENWQTNKSEILNLVNTWSQGWVNKDIESYISSYSKQEFRHPRKGGFNAYKNYKKRVFSRADKPKIDFNNISILSNGNYAVVTLEQDYNSEIIKDIGKKTLYLRKDANYNWKIVSEVFAKLAEENNIAFTPSMKYFSVGSDENNLSKN
jgi:murein L,D-transpeptidase YafK